MENPIKNPYLLLIILLVAAFSCQQEDIDLSSKKGEVRFGGISLEFAPMGAAGNRRLKVFPHGYIFLQIPQILFLPIRLPARNMFWNNNPNDFSTPNSIQLPLGAYEFFSKTEVRIFSDFLPFEANGEFILDSQNIEIGLKGKTDYDLISVKNQFLDKASVSDGSIKTGLALLNNGQYSYKYVKSGIKVLLKIIESKDGSTITREINALANMHFYFLLKLNEGTSNITDLNFEPFNLEDKEIIIGSNENFFDQNETIKFPQAIPGERGIVNGKSYEAVDRALLIQRRDEKADLSFVCTYLVTNMSEIFYNSDFNQNISEWDISNVTNLQSMFWGTYYFNQPIGNWDVSNLTNMHRMFAGTFYLNQPIEDWDVSNVTDLSYIFAETYFNQTFGDWDVTNVTLMTAMFRGGSIFNQDLSRW